MEIHCIESKKENFDDRPIEQIRKMVGWIEPPESLGDSWDVTTEDGGGFECKDQATAQIISSLEEIKAMLIGK